MDRLVHVSVRPIGGEPHRTPTSDLACTHPRAPCGLVCWQSFRAQDFPNSDDRVLLQLQDLAATKALVTDALSFGFSVSFVSHSAPQVWIAGGRRALQSYVGNVGERVDAPVTVTWASDGTAVLQ